jgi:hypothetical protein
MKTRKEDVSFPCHESIYEHSQGLTKREYFAAAALMGLMVDTSPEQSHEDVAESAVLMADALINELNKNKENPDAHPDQVQK